MQGAGITLTNLGGLGVDRLFPIINWPQAAIVGLAAVRWTQQRNNAGAWRELPMLPLSLAIDHRLINGADAARFIDRIGRLLEAPNALLVDSGTVSDALG